MTHEPIHTIHLTPHITWQGTQAELEAMQAEGWPLISAGEITAACKRDAAEAEAYAAELEAKLAKVKTSFRRNMMQAYPNYTHERFDKDFDEMLKGDKA